ncbi:hypothetical protein GXW74_12125 [Roseomonas eburnea]|uniref:Nitrogen fixation protein n=1 Tax=Neoroseomonas eburnea TaxID=1346889 RepID=A0A9X9XBZ7_9PROT|nr:hypothetical protein [Neoroseomonas eburnea]MBR0681233.1 hypothetical protein [Neoroseomonas eburnea]
MTRLCPSAPAEPGALVIGVVGPDGRVAHLATPLRADEAFVARLRREDASPETRFRFSGTCLEGRCAQWTGTGCGIIERVLARIDAAEAAAPLPRCGIRRDCRWHAQRGAAACHACPLVVTDQRE